MKYLLYLSFLLLAFASCHKDDTSFTNPSPTKATFSATMTGKWIWMGSAHSDEIPPPDAFTRFGIMAVTDKSVVCFDDTFKYVGFDLGTRIITYEYHDVGLAANLYFNTSDHSIELYYAGRHITENLNTHSYKPNKSLAAFIPNIVGTKTLIGMAYDTLIMRHPNDSMYNLNVQMQFTAINDSTLVFSPNFFAFYDDTLHYKLTNEATNTIVFQNFAETEFALTTLTYNITSKTVAFEQQYRGAGWYRYLKLQ